MSDDHIPLRDDFLNRLRTIRQHTSRGKRAPHKPLLLLIAFAGIVRGEERLFNYSDCDTKLSKLLIEFGPPVDNVKPFEPFKRLPKDNLWELVNVPVQSNDAIDQLTGGHLKRLDAKGGLLEKDYQLLRNNHQFLYGCINEILENNFPPSYHTDILQSVGLPTSGLNTVDLQQSSMEKTISYVRPRDTTFRSSILEIYECACSICRSAVRLEEKLMGLEAAHIRWHAHGGPDEESNGLALCSFHHKAFDRGVIGLRNISDGYKVELSGKLKGSGPAMDWLRNFEGKQIFKVENREHQPSPDYVAWHREQVFRN